MINTTYRNAKNWSKIESIISNWSLGHYQLKYAAQSFIMYKNCPNGCLYKNRNVCCWLIFQQDINQNSQKIFASLS